MTRRSASGHATCQVSCPSREATSGDEDHRNPLSEVIDAEGLVERTLRSRKRHRCTWIDSHSEHGKKTGNASQKRMSRIFSSQNNRGKWRDLLSHRRHGQAKILSRRGKRRALKKLRRRKLLTERDTYKTRTLARSLSVAAAAFPAASRSLGRAWDRPFICDISAALHTLPEMGPKASMVSSNASMPIMFNATSANSETLHHTRATRMAAPTFTTKMMTNQCPVFRP